MTQEDKNVVKAVFGELLRKPYNELNTFLGSYTIAEMGRVYSKLHHEPYCERHGIKFEDMTEDDFMLEYEEENYVSESDYEESRGVWDEIYNPCEMNYEDIADEK